MAQQWPTTAPSVSPGTHDPVATQAYQAGGGDYFRPGYYMDGVFFSAAMTTVALALSRMYLRPVFIPVRRAFDRIGINVTVAATAGGVVRMGIYSHDAGVPGALVLDAGTVASTTTGGKEITISQTLDPGWYWLAVDAQVAACTVTAYPAVGALPVRGEPNGTGPIDSLGFQSWNRLSVTGALPTPAGSNNSNAVMPAVGLRAV